MTPGSTPNGEFANPSGPIYPISLRSWAYNLTLALPPTVNVSKFTGNAALSPPDVTVSTAKLTGEAALSPPDVAVSASKFVGLGALSPPTLSASKLLGYAVLEPALAVSKLNAYGVVQQAANEEVSKLNAYGLTHLLDVQISKVNAYAVVVEIPFVPVKPRVFPSVFRGMLTANDGWHYEDWFPMPRRMPFRTRTCDDIWDTIDDPTKPDCNDWSAFAKGGGRTQ